MGIFTCCECDGYGDSDDGCMECKDHKFGLICQGCLEEMPEDIYEVKTGEKP